MGLFDYDQPAAEHAELQEITLLADLSEEDWGRVLNIVETHQFKSGEDLIRAGDEDDSFYILTGGQVDVVIDGDGEETVLSKSDDGKRILDEMCQTDEGDWLTIMDGNDYVGQIFFVYGNEPEYVVADHSTDKFTTRIVETVTMDYD